MPLEKGRSQKTISGNIRELHHGPNYAKTAAKHSKAVANRQAIAIAERTARGGKPHKADRAKHEPHHAIGHHA